MAKILSLLYYVKSGRLCKSTLRFPTSGFIQGRYPVQQDFTVPLEFSPLCKNIMMLNWLVDMMLWHYLQPNVLEVLGLEYWLPHYFGKHAWLLETLKRKEEGSFSKDCFLTCPWATRVHLMNPQDSSSGCKRYPTLSQCHMQNMSEPINGNIKTLTNQKPQSVLLFICITTQGSHGKPMDEAEWTIY